MYEKLVEKDLKKKTTFQENPNKQAITYRAHVKNSHLIRCLQNK